MCGKLIKTKKFRHKTFCTSSITSRIPQHKFLIVLGQQLTFHVKELYYQYGMDKINYEVIIKSKLSGIELVS